MSFATLLHKIANLPVIKKTLTESRLFVRLYFNWRYRKEDPYDLKNSEYEKEKLEEAVKALRFKEKFDSALEVGCGEGRLTRRIAEKTGSALATDISDLAIGRARDTLKGLENVECRRMDLFTDRLDDTFDLVICSEVLFYLEPDQFPVAVDRIKGWVGAGGYLLLVHVRATADDDSGIEFKKFGAKTIHETFINDPLFSKVSDEIFPMYRVTVLQKSRNVQ